MASFGTTLVLEEVPASVPVVSFAADVESLCSHIRMHTQTIEKKPERNNLRRLGKCMHIDERSRLIDSFSYLFLFLLLLLMGRVGIEVHVDIRRAIGGEPLGPDNRSKHSS